MTENANWQDVEARRRYDCAEDDKARILKMKRDMAEILANACTQAMYARGFMANERLREKLQDLLETEL